MDALSTSKSEEAAEAIAKHLTEQDSQQQAGQALKAMGELAEKPVLPMVKNSDWVTRTSACEILGAVGTSLSVDALKAATNDENGIVRMKAKDALKAINERAGHNS